MTLQRHTTIRFLVDIRADFQRTARRDHTATEQRWAITDPRLAAADFAPIWSSPQSMGSDCMHALISVGQSSDPCAQLAQQLVLMAMFPRVARLSRTEMPYADSIDEAAANAVSAMLITIARYPLHRINKVVANLSMDALAQLRRQRLATMHLDGADGLLDRPDKTAVSSSEELTAVLIWAHQQKIIDRDDAALMTRTYLWTDSYKSGNTSAERKRCQRIVKKLAAAAPQFELIAS